MQVEFGTKTNYPFDFEFYCALLPDKAKYKILSYLPNQLLVDLNLSNEQYYRVYQARIGNQWWNPEVNWLSKFLSTREMLLKDYMYIMSLTDLELHDDMFNSKIPVKKNTKVIFREYLDGYVWHPSNQLIDVSKVKQVLNTRDGTGISGFYFDGGTTNQKVLDLFNKYFFEYLWNNPDYNPDDYADEYNSDDSLEELGNPTLRFDESCYNSKNALDDSKSSKDSDEDIQFDFRDEFGHSYSKKEPRTYRDQTLSGWPSKLIRIPNTHFIPVIFYLHIKPDLKEEELELRDKTKFILSDGEYYLWKCFAVCPVTEERKDIGRVVLSPKLHVNLVELAGIALFADESEEKREVYGFGNFKNRRIGDELQFEGRPVFGQGNYAIVTGRPRPRNAGRRFYPGPGSPGSPMSP